MVAGGGDIIAPMVILVSRENFVVEAAKVINDAVRVTVKSCVRARKKPLVNWL